MTGQTMTNNITPKRHRRYFSLEYKKLMLLEAETTNIYRVALAHQLAPAIVYLWRKKFQNTLATQT
jgi:transposase-like protein